MPVMAFRQISPSVVVIGLDYSTTLKHLMASSVLIIFGLLKGKAIGRVSLPDGALGLPAGLAFMQTNYQYVLPQSQPNKWRSVHYRTPIRMIKTVFIIWFSLSIFLAVFGNLALLGFLSSKGVETRFRLIRHAGIFGQTLYRLVQRTQQALPLVIAVRWASISAPFSHSFSLTDFGTPLKQGVPLRARL